MVGKALAWIVAHLTLIYKIVAVLVTVLLLTLMFPHDTRSEHYDYSVGTFWRGEDLYAPFNFAVIKDPETIEREMAEAKSKSLLYYTIDSTAHIKAIRNIEKNPRLVSTEQRRLRRMVDSIYRVGYMEIPADFADIDNHTLVLLEGNIGSEHTAQEYVQPKDIDDNLLRDSILVASIVFDSRRTQLELDSRLSQSQYSSEMIMAGSLIIAKGEYVSEEKARIVSSLEQENDRVYNQHYNAWGRNLGRSILCLLAFIALFMFMQMTKHSILEDNKKVTFVLTIILLMAAVTAIVVRLDADQVLLIPLCIIPILMRVFFDMRVALYIHLTAVIILANMVPNSFEFIFYQLVTGMMSLITVKEFDRRRQFFIVCVVIFVTYSLIYVAGVLSQDTHLDNLTWSRFGTFLLNAILTLLAYPLIYIFEKLFGMATPLTLMELSSTNHPLLRELSKKAPGTFQHAMQVANISEDLINEIGGNALLAKVGALYHDIGKIEAPLYFTENQNSGFNPHDELDYVESAHVIIQHVRDGADLAKKYRLPGEVTDFIRTHHGTTVTGYFFAKQKQEHPDETLTIADFRYPGPTPFSRETAVVMIVDSVEAACKSLKQPDKENIDKLIDSVIASKVEYNQLQNCDLTYGDISQIKRILKNKILSIYHARISYPVLK